MYKFTFCYLLFIWIIGVTNATSFLDAIESMAVEDINYGLDERLASAEERAAFNDVRNDGRLLGGNTRKRSIDSFIGRDVWWNKDLSLAPIRDQGSCGQCWMVAAATVLEMHNNMLRKREAEASGTEYQPVVLDQRKWGACLEYLWEQPDRAQDSLEVMGSGDTRSWQGYMFDAKCEMSGGGYFNNRDTGRKQRRDQAKLIEMIVAEDLVPKSERYRSWSKLDNWGEAYTDEDRIEGVLFTIWDRIKEPYFLQAFPDGPEQFADALRGTHVKTISSYGFDGYFGYSTTVNVTCTSVTYKKYSKVCDGGWTPWFWNSVYAEQQRAVERRREFGYTQQSDPKPSVRLSLKPDKRSLKEQPDYDEIYRADKCDESLLRQEAAPEIGKLYNVDPFQDYTTFYEENEDGARFGRLSAAFIYSPWQAYQRDFKTKEMNITLLREVFSSIMGALEYGPTAVAMTVCGNFTKLREHTTGWIAGGKDSLGYNFYDTNCTFPGGHAIVLVGYHYTGNFDDSYWIIQNSWGTKWGNDGFGFLKMGGSKIRSVAVPLVRPRDGSTYANPLLPPVDPGKAFPLPRSSFGACALSLIDSPLYDQDLSRRWFTTRAHPHLPDGVPMGRLDECANGVKRLLWEAASDEPDAPTHPTLPVPHYYAGAQWRTFAVDVRGKLPNVAPRLIRIVLLRNSAAPLAEDIHVRFAFDVDGNAAPSEASMLGPIVLTAASWRQHADDVEETDIAAELPANMVPISAIHWRVVYVQIRNAVGRSGGKLYLYAANLEIDEDLSAQLRGGAADEKHGNTQSDALVSTEALSWLVAAVVGVCGIVCFGAAISCLAMSRSKRAVAFTRANGAADSGAEQPAAAPRASGGGLQRRASSRVGGSSARGSRRTGGGGSGGVSRSVTNRYMGM